MGRFVPGTRIVLVNSADCELDSEFVPDRQGDEIKETLSEVLERKLRRNWIVNPGDRILFVETESEV